MAKKVEFEKITSKEMARDVLITYFALNEEAKRIEKKQESLKAAIKDYMGEEKEITEGDYKAVISESSRSSISQEAVEKKFNIKLTEDCFKVTTFGKLSVKKVEE